MKGAARLCIFSRLPVLGRVKTRLAAELGEQAALEAHTKLVEDTLGRLARVPGVVSELWLDGEADAVARGWAKTWQLEIRCQCEGDLGERMHDALLRSLSVAPCAMVVGTDCPPIDLAYAERARAALDQHDVVLGPAADGGYGLVGIRRSAPQLFREMPWGTERVLEATLNAAARARLSVFLLEEIWDVDTAADWRRYLASGRS